MKIFNKSGKLLLETKGADLQNADLRRVSWCGATLDGIILDPNGSGGPGHILFALTSVEAELIKKGRGGPLTEAKKQQQTQGEMR